MLLFSYRSTINCPECGQDVPFNQLRGTMLCSHCQSVVDLAQHERAWWLDPVIGELLTRMLLKRPDYDIEHTTTKQFHVDFFRGPANCPTCRQPLDAARLAAGAASGTFTCACGFSTPCRNAEPSLVQLFRYSRWLLGEAPSQAGAPQGTHAMMTPCMSCGAGLRVDGSSREVQCTFCNTSNYLPDGLWLRLHPVPKMEWFALVIDIDEASLAAELQRKSPLDALDVFVHK